MKKAKKVRDLKPHPRNPNKGTPHGADAVEKSLSRLGAGRSVVLDKNGRIIAGNQTVEAAKKAGIEELLIVETDGKKLVAVQRMDLDLDSAKAQELAVADNRASELGLDWDPDVLKLMQDEGADLGEYWGDEQLEKLLSGKGRDGSDVILDQSVQLKPQQQFVVVVCEDEDEWAELKYRLRLKPVRRGGYKEGSPFDSSGTERVLTAKRVLEELGALKE